MATVTRLMSSFAQPKSRQCALSVRKLPTVVIVIILARWPISLSPTRLFVYPSTFKSFFVITLLVHVVSLLNACRRLLLHPRDEPSASIPCKPNLVWPWAALGQLDLA